METDQVSQHAAVVLYPGEQTRNGWYEDVKARTPTTRPLKGGFAIFEGRSSVDFAT